jgi:fucose permease
VKKTAYAAGIFLALFYYATLNNTHGPLLSDIINHYGLSEARKGMAVAAQNTGSIIALISSLFIMGRVAKPYLLCFSVAICALLMLPIGLPPVFSVFLGLFVVLGISAAYIDMTASSAIADLYEGKTAVRMMCALHAVFGMAGMVMPLAFQALMTNTLTINGVSSTVSWNGVYFAVFAFGALLSAYIMPVSIRRARAEAASSDTRGQKMTLNGLTRFLRDRIMLLILAAIFVYAFFFSGFTIWIKRYISESLGDDNIGSLALSVFWLGMTASRLLSPFIRLSPIMQIRWFSLAAALVLAIGLLVSNALFICAASALTGLLAGAAIPLAIHVACERFRDNTMMASASILLVLYVAQIICPPLMGIAETTFGLKWAMAVCPAALALCGSLLFFVGRSKNA